jgi:hypothetical protein
MEIKFFLWKSSSSCSIKGLGMGKSENVFISQDELSHRAEMNKLASLGQWEEELEDR